MLKSELRETCLAKQKAISEQDRTTLSRSISELFFANFDLDGVSCVHSFIPIAKFNEVDTYMVFETVWQEFPHVMTVVPRVDYETGEITNLKFDRTTALVRNVWDIDEPSHHQSVEPETIDLVLVPGVCFDRNGHRVGYGKGFYDRLLKKCRPDCVKIGLSYFEPVEQIDDTYEGDMKLDFIVTPQRAIEFLNA